MLPLQAVTRASERSSAAQLPLRWLAMSHSADPRPLRLWSALEYRDYRVLWVSSIAWMLTQQLRLLVTAVWLFEATGSAAQLGLIGAIQLVVQIPALLFGGALADRIDRKLLMAATQAVTFGVVAMLAVLASSGELEPWHVYLATAITSVTTVLGQPARSALTAVVVPRNYLMHAVATNNVTIQIGSIAAPLLFAGIAEGAGLTPVFYLVAGVAAASAVLPLGIRASGRPEGIRRSSLAREVWEGARFVARHPILPGLYALDFAITVVSFYRQIMPVIAAQLYGRGAGAVGMLTAANSLGAAAGGFLVLLLARYRAKGMIVLYATLFYGVLLFPFGLVEELWIGIVLIAFLGAADAVGMTMRQTTVQLTTPDEMRGRALSLQTLAAQSANNIGTLEVGLMSAWIGAGGTMVVGGVISLSAIALIWRRFRGIRSYRYPADEG